LHRRFASLARFVMASVTTKLLEARRVGLLALTASLALLVTGPAGAADVDALQAKVAAGRSKASALAAQLQAAQSELASAEGEAAAAGARERRLSRLLRTGRERAARLAAAVERTERRLAAERRRLRRARAALAARLVAIYESGSPSAASVVLAADDFEELATRVEYLSQIEQSDADLALRVAQVRHAVAHELRRVATLKERVDAYNARLDSARAEIAAVRESAEAASARLQAVEASRTAALGTLKAEIGEWIEDIQAAKAAEAERISAAEAEGEVERWLGGPYSIPTYIVMCESGGNYGAVNPSSGAGGAYQVLPSTWALYGGQGAPQDASKSEQDRIAAEIWADSGSGAWVCG
jgi:septal ring factor EnvC (AmiA/AmiB activator)